MLVLGRDVYQLGSLSHAINAEAFGYQKLPDFPEDQPDPTVRNVEVCAGFGEVAHCPVMKY